MYRGNQSPHESADSEDLIDNVVDTVTKTRVETEETKPSIRRLQRRRVIEARPPGDSWREDVVAKVVIRCTEHVPDFQTQLVDPAVTQPLAASQQRVETCAVSGRAPAGPRRCRVLDARNRNDDTTKYIM